MNYILYFSHITVLQKYFWYWYAIRWMVYIDTLFLQKSMLSLPNLHTLPIIYIVSVFFARRHETTGGPYQSVLAGAISVSVWCVLTLKAITTCRHTHTHTFTNPLKPTQTKPNIILFIYGNGGLAVIRKRKSYIMPLTWWACIYLGVVNFKRAPLTWGEVEQASERGQLL